MVTLPASTSQPAQLEALRQAIRKDDAAPLELTVGTRSIELSPWVRHQLQQWSLGAGDQLHYQVADGIATRMMLFGYVEKLEVADYEGSVGSAPPSVRFAEDLEEARRLVIQLQRSATELFAASRHHDSQQIQRQAEELRVELHQLERMAGLVPAAATADDPPAERPIGRATRPRGWHRARVLVAVLLLLAAVRIAMFLLVERTAPLPLLGPADFADLAGIEEVVARPPSLYLTVNDDWPTLDPAERQATVQQVGRRLDAAGYSGALFQDDAGRTRARWLRRSGPEIVD